MLTLDCTEEDINNSLNEAVTFRQYFEVVDNKVTVPVFFTCIEGVYENMADYLLLFDRCNTLENSLNIVEIRELLNSNLNETNILNIALNKFDEIFNITERRYAKYFVKYENMFNLEKIINSRETGLSKYNLELQKYLLRKLNEYINDSSVLPIVEDRYKIKLFYMICNLSNELIDKLSNFNVAKVSPKIILFLEGEECLDKLGIVLLGYLRYLGIDIIIFAPSASANLELVLNERLFSKIKLKVINPNVKYSLLNGISEYIDRASVPTNELREVFKYLGYNSDLEVYKSKIRILKYPMLYSLKMRVGSKNLVLTGSVGIVISLICLIMSIIPIIMIGVGAVFSLILLLGMITMDKR